MMPQRMLIGIVMVVVVASAGIGFWYLLGQRDTGYVGPVEKITVAGAKSGALVYIAQDQGYFRENGLDVTINDYAAGKLATDALLVGEADIATSAEFVFVSNSFDHDDMRVLGVMATADICKVVARKDKGITQPTALNGKKIGVTRKSAGEFYLGTFLTINGLSLTDVEIVDLNPSAIVEAMTNGTIDAALTWEPHIYNIETHLKDNIVVWDGQSGTDFYFIAITNEGWLEEHVNAAERFLHALVQAEQYTKEHDEQASQILVDHFQLSSQDIQVFWPDHQFVVVLPQALLLAMEDEARWSIKNHLTNTTEVPNYLDYIYFHALEEVKPEAITIIH